MRMPQRPSRQSGVALITALLIAALVTVAAVAMASRQHLDMRRTGNMLEADQAYVYALGGEMLAKLVLLEDINQSDIDTLLEPWATPLPPTTIEGGMITGRIEDLQGRLNLNTLVKANGEVEPKQIKALQSLLAQVGESVEGVDFSPFLANRVADWIDPDLNALADGAEDLDYLGLTLPYRAGNQFMASPSEVVAVAGFQEQGGSAGIGELLNLVSALPEFTPVNVNTASLAVLMSLHEDIDERIAAEILEQAANDPFERVDEFVDLLLRQYAIELEPDYASRFLSVNSHYFLATVEATIGRTHLTLYSLLNRKNKTVITLTRSIGTL